MVGEDAGDAHGVLVGEGAQAAAFAVAALDLGVRAVQAGGRGLLGGPGDQAAGEAGDASSLRSCGKG